MTTTTRTASPISQGTPSDPPPSWRDRRPSWGGPRGRTLAIALAVAAVLALAVPVGLARLGGGVSPTAESAAVGGAPGLLRDAGSSAGSGSAGSVAPEANDSVAPAPDAPAGSTAGSKPDSKLGSGTVTSDAAAARRPRRRRSPARRGSAWRSPTSRAPPGVPASSPPEPAAP